MCERYLANFYIFFNENTIKSVRVTGPGILEAAQSVAVLTEVLIQICPSPAPVFLSLLSEHWLYWPVKVKLKLVSHLLRVTLGLIYDTHFPPIIV